MANVQIDTVQSPGDIAKALAQLEALAKERGIAIGVASAKPATVKQLAAWAEQLKGKGIRPHSRSVPPCARSVKADRPQ